MQCIPISNILYMIQLRNCVITALIIIIILLISNNNIVYRQIVVFCSIAPVVCMCILYTCRSQSFLIHTAYYYYISIYIIIYNRLLIYVYRYYHIIFNNSVRNTLNINILCIFSVDQTIITLY